MQNSEILRRYRREVNTDSYEEIHKKYRKERQVIASKDKVEDKLSTPLLFLIIASVIGDVFVFFRNDGELDGYLFIIFTLLIIIFSIWRKIYRKTIDKKESKALKNYLNGSELSDLRFKYLSEYNSVIGYFDNLYSSTGKCGDYDENSEICTCSVTGQPIDYLEYSYQCQRPGKCYSCPKFNDYFNHLYDE